MRIAIVGAGVSGVSSAYALTLAGHAVTVFDRRHSVAAEGSFAQSALCSTFMPWLGPGRSLRMGSLSGRLHWTWWWQHWRAGRPAQAEPRHAALHALALASQAQLDAWDAGLHLSFEQAPGALVLLRSSKDVERARRTWADGPDGSAPRLLDAATCRQLEPHLNPALPLAAGALLAQGGVGNARQLAHQLKAAAQRLGASFEFDNTVLQLRPGPQPAIATARDGERSFDAVVLCAGTGSARLLAKAGLRLPLHTVQQFALTAPLGVVEGQPHTGPQAGVLDARSGITVARIGSRVRVAGLTAFAGSGHRLLPWAMTTLDRALEATYPGAAIGRRAQQWAGGRSRLPDGAPLIGPSSLAGVWLNTAHGATGWPLACGSAQWLADLMAGKPPTAAMAWLGVERLR